MQIVLYFYVFFPFSGCKLCWTCAIHLVSMQTTLWPSVVYLWCRYLCSLLPQCQFHLHWERHRPACWSLQVCLTQPFPPSPAASYTQILSISPLNHLSWIYILFVWNWTYFFISCVARGFQKYPLAVGFLDGWIWWIQGLRWHIMRVPQ